MAYFYIRKEIYMFHILYPLILFTLDYEIFDTSIRMYICIDANAQHALYTYIQVFYYLLLGNFTGISIHVFYPACHKEQLMPI